MAICRHISRSGEGRKKKTHVFKLGLAQRRAVGGNQNQLGLPGADGLHGGLGAHGDLARLHDEREAGGEAELSIAFSDGEERTYVSPVFLALAILLVSLRWSCRCRDG